ncbi:alpha/beta fold hydrolase [Frankia sp. AgB32]|uniref:alpha/beta fold hydrolase n=1 Tax=Frankia sp. AgB32 TaxID=631119 RepID=UPI00200EE2CA|nr:alpha/beta hydrolase [Frankia sp. AgB32]
MVTDIDGGQQDRPTPAPALHLPGDGLEVAADAYGDPADPPVVLLPGGGQTRHSWRRTARRFGDHGWYALTVDLRGHGDSGWAPDGDYAFERFAADILVLCGALSQPPVLVGASLGGLAALIALGREPEVARGLVLVDVSPFLQNEGTARITGFMRSAPEGFASPAEAADAVAAYLPHRERPRDTSGLRRNLRLVNGRWFWHWDPVFLFPPGEPDPARVNRMATDLAAAAAGLRLPTMLVRGSRSDVVSEGDAHRFLTLVPHADYSDVAGAHHMVAGDDNASFDERILDFLDRRIRPRLILDASLSGDPMAGDEAAGDEVCA